MIYYYKGTKVSVVKYRKGLEDAWDYTTFIPKNIDLTLLAIPKKDGGSLLYPFIYDKNDIRRYIKKGDYIVRDFYDRHICWLCSSEELKGQDYASSKITTADWIKDKILPALEHFTPIDILGKKFNVAHISEADGYKHIVLMENRVMDMTITCSIKI